MASHCVFDREHPKFFSIISNNIVSIDEIFKLGTYCSCASGIQNCLVFKIYWKKKDGHITLLEIGIDNLFACYNEQILLQLK